MNYEPVILKAPPTPPAGWEIVPENLPLQPGDRLWDGFQVRWLSVPRSMIGVPARCFVRPIRSTAANPVLPS